MAQLIMTAASVQKSLKAKATPERAKSSQWFFKTGPGQYGAGDQFLGVTVPDQRKIAKQFKNLPLAEIELLLASPIHEHRLTALHILVLQFAKADEKNKTKLYRFYLTNRDHINNWDLVDTSAPYIVGNYLLTHPAEKAKLKIWAKSKIIWERRIAVVATWLLIRNKEYDEILQLAEQLKTDPHDLMHKAVGWMLREVGKKNPGTLVNFLNIHANTLPRTTLRYAIEKMTPEQRRYYLDLWVLRKLVISKKKSGITMPPMAATLRGDAPPIHTKLWCPKLCYNKLRLVAWPKNFLSF